MANNFIYQFSGSVYFNLTNRCPNNCSFCIRHIKNGVSGSELWLEHEPTIEELMRALEGMDLSSFKEAVFCGFGEPMCRLDLILAVSPYLKERGLAVRVNTNGLGDLINKKRTAPLLKECVDEVSVSLNAPSKEEYAAVCRSVYGDNAYYAMLNFTKDCVAEGISTVMSVVDVIGEEKIERCRALAKSLGAKFRVRAEIKKDTEY